MRTGISRARLVACGYSQIPRVNFQDYYVAVVNDTVIILLLCNLSSIIMDVETAFLPGDLKETIYMQSPRGTQIPNQQCVTLNKALYELVQAARKFYLMFAEILKQIGFTKQYMVPQLGSRLPVAIRF
jgi:hypothetical protein